MAFERDGHIAGAHSPIWCTIFRTRPRPFRLPGLKTRAMEETAGTLGLSNDTRVIVYDRSNGIWAARLWWLLKAYGHDAVAVLDGGLKKWAAEGRPFTYGNASVARSSFRVQQRDGYFVDKEEVVAMMEGRTPGRLVCVLRASGIQRRRGALRAGRAHSRQHQYSLRQSHRRRHECFSGAGQRFARSTSPPALSGRERLILYCGGGVTAAGSALALTILGVDNIAVYDGSLNEWAADARHCRLRTGTV